MMNTSNRATGAEKKAHMYQKVIKCLAWRIQTRGNEGTAVNTKGGSSNSSLCTNC